MNDAINCSEQTLELKFVTVGGGKGEQILKRQIKFWYKIFTFTEIFKHS